LILFKYTAMRPGKAYVPVGMMFVPAGANLFIVLEGVVYEAFG
jgi:hypothetical protein